MRSLSRARRALLAIVCFAAGGGGAQGAEPPGAGVFGELPEQGQAALSPDGHWLAWYDRKESRTRIVLFDVDAHKTARMLGLAPGSEVRALGWLDEHTLLMTTSSATFSQRAGGATREVFRTTAQDVSSDTGQQLGSVFAHMVSAHISKPHTVIMATNLSAFGDAKSTLFAVDTLTGAETILRQGEAHTNAWIVDHDGTPVAREEWDWYRHQYRVYSLIGRDPREILRRDDTEPPILGGLLPDRTALVLLATNGRSHQAAWALPLDGTPLKLLSEDPQSDITRVFTDAYTDEVIGVYASGAATEVRWLDAAARKRQETLAHAFPGRRVEPYGWNRDGSRTLARVSSPTSPPVYYLVDYHTHRADIAAEEYPRLAGVPLAEVKQISYKARDGTDIPAYLTLPPARATALPLVVLPHGGPNARDYPVFDWLVQFLATRGYAVLQPEYRGSTGFGDAFRDAGDRQWGGRMQDDVTDGARAMAAQGIADPHRVCIVGTSGYSGYAALAGATFTPEVYACVVSINGIADLPELMKQTVPDAGTWVSTRQTAWKKHIGGYRNTRQISPINFVGAVVSPVLIMYGADDYVPPAQSQSMAEALKKAGKDVTVVKLPDGIAWRERSEVRIQILEELDRFLGASLQSGGARGGT